MRSPPARRRGLKHRKARNYHVLQAVASRAEAWIETVEAPRLPLQPGASPPARRRGLKPQKKGRPQAGDGSPPARRRGLKLRWRARLLLRPDVASRAEAWIETWTRQRLAS